MLRAILLLSMLCLTCSAAEVSDRTLWKRMLAAGEKELKAEVSKLEAERDAALAKGKPEFPESATHQRAVRAAEAIQSKIAELEKKKGEAFPLIELKVEGMGVLKDAKTFAAFDDATLLQRGEEWFWVEPAGFDAAQPLLCTCVTKAEIEGKERTVYVLVKLKKP